MILSFIYIPCKFGALWLEKMAQNTYTGKYSKIKK